MLAYYGLPLPQEVKKDESITNRPRLTTRYHEAYYYRPFAFLIVLLEFKNSGDRQTAVTDFKAVLRASPKTEYPVLMSPGTMTNIKLIQLGVSPGANDMFMILLPEESIQYRATAKPIMPGLPVRGWLMFQLPKNTPPNGLAISFNDADDRMYSIALEDVKEIPPLPELGSTQRFPDITYPFRERDVMEKIQKQRMVKP